MAREDGSVVDQEEIRGIAAEAAGGEPVTISDEGSAASSAGDSSLKTATDASSGGEEAQQWQVDLGPEYAELSQEQALARLKEERASLARVPELQRQAERAVELERYLQQQQQQIAAWQYQQQLATQQAQQAQQRQEAQAKQKADIPEWKPEWREGIEVNDKGQIIAKSGYDPTLPQKYVARQAWERERLSQLMEDPSTFVMQHVQEALYQGIDQRVQQHVAQFVEEQSVKAFDDENRKWLWTNPEVRNGPEDMSRWGRQCIAIARSLVLQGVGRTVALNMAKDQCQAQAWAEQAAKQAAGGGQSQQANGDAEYLRKAAAAGAKRGGSRSGTGRSAPAPLPRGPGGMPDIKQMFQEDFEKAGLLANGTAW